VRFDDIFNAKYGHYKVVQNYDIIRLTITIITVALEQSSNLNLRAFKAVGFCTYSGLVLAGLSLRATSRHTFCSWVCIISPWYLPFVDTLHVIHTQTKKFVSGMNIEATGDSKLNDSPASVIITVGIFLAKLQIILYM